MRTWAMLKFRCLYSHYGSCFSIGVYRQQGVFATTFRLSARLRIMDVGLGRWIYMVLRQHSRIDLSLLQHQSTSEEKYGRLLRQWRLQDLSLQCQSPLTLQQLDKSLWPSQILLVCHLGKGLTTPETQTLY